MSDETPQVEHGEVVEGRPQIQGEEAPLMETVTEPAKVMRIGSMVKQLLEEVRGQPLDEASRERLAEIYERSVVELSEALSPDLQEELRTLALPFSATPRYAWETSTVKPATRSSTSFISPGVLMRFEHSFRPR